MKEDWMWHTRCPDTGEMVSVCCCDYCFEEVGMDNVDDNYDDEDFWLTEEILDFLDEEYDYDEWGI